MFKRIVNGQMMFAVLLGSGVLLSQQLPRSSSSAAGMEFPVVMRQSIVAGKTPIGTKVQAKLVAATLVNGVVVPRDATLSGEVTDSAKNPHRLLRASPFAWIPRTGKRIGTHQSVFDRMVLPGSGSRESGSFVSTSRCRQQQEKLEWDGHIPRSE